MIFSDFNFGILLGVNFKCRIADVIAFSISSVQTDWVIRTKISKDIRGIGENRCVEMRLHTGMLSCMVFRSAYRQTTAPILRTAPVGSNVSVVSHDFTDAGKRCTNI